MNVSLDQKFTFIAYIITMLTPIVLISFTVASIKDPGHLRPDHKFMDLLSNIHSCEMCPDCEVLRTPRSRHCAICNHCVERFDHHCPYINNCVGIGNHNVFLVFLVSLLMLIVALIVSNIIHLVDHCDPDRDGDGKCPLDEFCLWKDLCKNRIVEIAVNVTQLAFLAFFALPFSGLMVCVTTKNFCKGKTTSEMYSKRARSQSTTASQSELTETQSIADNQSITSDLNPLHVYKVQSNHQRRSNWVLNCRDMCCRRRVLTQKELLQVHLAETTVGTRTSDSLHNSGKMQAKPKQEEEKFDFKESLLSGYVDSGKGVGISIGVTYNSIATGYENSLVPMGTIENEQDLNANLDRIERRALSVVYTTEGSSKTEDLRDTIEVQHIEVR